MTVDEFKKLVAQRGGRSRGRHEWGKMNRTEAEYARLLDIRAAAGEVLGYEFEAMTFVLARGLRFTPDFVVWLADGSIECVDVKGSGPIQDDALAKIKMAAERFKRFRWVQEQKRRRRDGGGWKRREF